MTISIGSKAPDFTLKSMSSGELGDIQLSANYGEKNTLLLFVPLAFTGVCTQELCDVSGGLDAYSDLNANVIAISVHNATLNSSDLTFVPTLIQIPSGKGGGPGPGAGDLFLRGDVDDNGFVNLTDAVSLLLYLFQQGNEPSCLDSTDIDDNGFLNLTDGVSLLNHLFRAGPAPQPPGFLECGEDPTEDTLGDCTSSGCAEEG